MKTAARRTRANLPNTRHGWLPAHSAVTHECGHAGEPPRALPKGML